MWLTYLMGSLMLSFCVGLVIWCLLGAAVLRSTELPDFNGYIVPIAGWHCILLGGICLPFCLLSLYLCLFCDVFLGVSLDFKGMMGYLLIILLSGRVECSGLYMKLRNNKADLEGEGGPLWLRIVVYWFSLSAVSLILVSYGLLFLLGLKSPSASSMGVVFLVSAVVSKMGEAFWVYFDQMSTDGKKWAIDLGPKSEYGSSYAEPAEKPWEASVWKLTEKEPYRGGYKYSSTKKEKTPKA